MSDVLSKSNSSLESSFANASNPYSLEKLLFTVSAHVNYHYNEVLIPSSTSNLHVYIAVPPAFFTLH